MSHHVAVMLPDGRNAVANYDDPIVKVMRRIHMDSIDPKKTVKDEDNQAVSEWLEANSAQSALCRETVFRLSFRQCNHR